MGRRRTVGDQSPTRRRWRSSDGDRTRWAKLASELHGQAEAEGRVTDDELTELKRRVDSQ